MASPLPDRLLFLPLLLGFEGILYSSVGPRGVAVGVKGTVQGRLSRATAPPTSGPPQAQGVTLCFRPPARGLRPPRGAGPCLPPLLCTVRSTRQFLKAARVSSRQPSPCSQSRELAPQPP